MAKFRQGFVSNSSSSSFIVLLPNTKLTPEELKINNDTIIEEWDDFKWYQEYQNDIERIKNATQNNQIIDSIEISYNDSDIFEQIEVIIEKCGGYLTSIGDY